MKPIAVFSPYPEMSSIFESMRPDCPVDFEVFDLLCDEALPVAKEVFEQGCKLIITRGETATMLKSESSSRE